MFFGPIFIADLVMLKAQHVRKDFLVRTVALDRREGHVKSAPHVS